MDPSRSLREAETLPPFRGLPMFTICSGCKSVMVEHPNGFNFHCHHCDTRHRMADCTVCTTGKPEWMA